MSTDRLRIESNERVDIQDFRHLAQQGDAESRQILDNIFVNPNKTRTWILEGFAMSNPSAKQLQVDMGRAILAKRSGGITQYGVLATSGDATRIVDLNTYTPGTYGVYIRFEEVEAETESRIFWNPAGDGSEYTQTIATRYTANWSVRVESTNPGSEWTKIGEVDQATMGIEDMREFYFEGQKTSGSDAYESGWSDDGGGSADDRDDDRSVYGISDFQTFTAAMRQCIEDIKGRGLRRWWNRSIGGLNIGFDADPSEDRVAIADADHWIGKATGVAYWHWGVDDEFRFSSYEGTFKIAGSDRWKTTAYGLEAIESSQDLGRASSKWRDLYLSGEANIDGNVYADTVEVETALLPDSAKGADVGSLLRPFNLTRSHRFWAQSASGDADYPGFFIYSGDGDEDKRAWRFVLDDVGTLQLDMVDDDGLFLNTAMRVRRSPGTNYISRFELWGNSSDGAILDLFHDGGGGSRNRYRLQVDDDRFKFNLSSDDGTSTAEQFRIAYDSGIQCYLEDWQMSYWKLGYIKPAHTDSSLGDATDPWPILELATGASKGAKTIEPYANSSSYTLGTSSYPWHTAHIDHLELGYGTGEGISSPVYPDADGTRQFGLATRRFLKMFLRDEMRIHKDSVGSVTIELGSGTTADDRKWDIIASNIFSISARDQNWASGQTALSIYRSGDSVTSIRFGADILPASSGGSGNIGTSVYYFVEGWLGNLYLKHTDPLIRMHDTSQPSYWEMKAHGNSLTWYRTNSSWASPQPILDISMSDEDTVVSTQIHGTVLLPEAITHDTTDWTSDANLPVNAGASQTYMSYFKVNIGGTDMAVPYIPWADIDDNP